MRSLMILFTTLFALIAFKSEAAMDIAAYQSQATTDNAAHGRCAKKAISATECVKRIDWAVREGYITARAGEWGKANGFYPVVDFYDRTVGAVCKCGCFEANTLIRVTKGGDIVDVAAKHIDDSYGLVGLAKDASLSLLSTNTFEMRARTKGAEESDLYVFILEDGSELKVTQHHGMLLGNGAMVAAKDVELGQTMLRADGVELSVASITREPTKQDVYNFETNGAEVVNHIIIANDILVGDLTWQNQLQAELGQVVVRQ
ncbi:MULTISPECIES: Hint domain-containing protein [unclassified Pseudoalteromonas]|uniref:Hint domain-containing protein n=1 Tax=unclassified Pseudoalteromonas TaxID=194690 RepID=UPI001F3B825B|nr:MULTISPECIES: Hint domain-containing protein [unclassified Pseudoalteromonas]MCF2828087.1 Hint domain-containing protein [Pseudoalteromonas sp. OF5H-5]MCF2831756.1 Hint domain-containing protein [Pseudoalteromonas sp. DL2-H6]MCF2924130.1 Hint domain-containing protein [Pseudoalteromonas sp. DL2-H1]